jgi:hypothetical protein
VVVIGAKQKQDEHHIRTGDFENLEVLLHGGVEINVVGANLIVNDEYYTRT